MKLLLSLAIVLNGWCVSVSIAAAEPIRIVTLHTVLTELAREIGGAQVDVTPLLRPGSDPHVFEPTPADIARLRRADIVLAAGLGMETYLERIKADLKAGVVLDVGAALPNPLRTGDDHDHAHHDHGHAHDHDHDHGETDPHWWHSLECLQAAVDIVARRLSEARPAAAGEIQQRANSVRARFTALQTWARETLSVIPPEKRILITSHDAFGYLARDYGFKVYAILGASTVDEANARHVAAIIQRIRREGVRTVFAETSSSPRLLESIVRETSARPGRPLWADGLGNEPENATIEAMFRHNLTAIVDGLRPR